MKSRASKFLSRQQVEDLLEMVRVRGSARDYYLLSCCYLLALRIGEVVCLRPSLFALDRGEVLVPTEKRRKAPGGVEVDRETGRPLLPVPVLHGDHVLRACLGWGAGRRWLFVGARKGSHLSSWYAAEVVKSWFRAAHLPSDASSHALRHTAGSVVYAATRDPVVVRDYLRHSSVTTTDSYLHALPSRWAEVRQKMGGSC